MSRLRLPAVALALVTACVAVPWSAVPSSADDGTQVITVARARSGDRLGALTAYARLMALPSIDTGEVVGSNAPRETGADACPPKRCEDRRVKVPSGVRVTTSMVRVLLPRGYHLERNADKRYPVIFMWSGALSNYKAWAEKTELLEMSENWPAIFVLPSGGYGKTAGMMSDWHNGRFQWETFHTDVVVPWVDQNYRTIPGARASVGASMGSIGVFTYPAHNPGMFRAGLSISGALDTSSMTTSGLPDAFNPIADLANLRSTKLPSLRKVWGNPVTDKAYWDAHNPTALAPKLTDYDVFIASGTGYGGAAGADDIHSGTFERSMWNTHRTFLLALGAADVGYTARVALGGSHDWRWFNDPLRWGVPKLLKAMRSAG